MFKPKSKVLAHRYVMAAALCLAASANAAPAPCMLPVADGSDLPVSPHNLHGLITRVHGHTVEVRQDRTARTVRVRLPVQAEIYTAYGGDVERSTLQPGLTVWVWFKACQWPRTGDPVSAYFQVFSTDPNDKPSSSR